MTSAAPWTIATLLAATLPPALQAQFPAQHDDPNAPMYVAPASGEGLEAIATFTLAPGLQVRLAAAEPDLCNVVAFAIDEQGRIYVSETFRIHDGVFDTREHMVWKDEDLACRTVADRVAKYEQHLAEHLATYARYSERVKLLFDDDGDARVDRSVVFADGFAELADGIASGVLPIGTDVWFTDIPRLWRLGDADGDGVAEARQAVFTGFGVHTSLIGHDLHGLVLGPDRRLYFSIGDRGLSVATREGSTLELPDEGAVLRCELDGSGLEVVHRGLRNPQELAFDDRGNLFTGDNNSDGGDRARFVQVVDGADSGWRIGFQWLDDRGAWRREHMWQPQRDDQPAWILPPLANVADGPSGLTFDPGLGLPARYRDCFFLCDFRGGRSYSGVHALRLQNDGAGFEIAFRDRPIWGVLATDVDFAPDGALYVSDWVSTWNKTGKGRLYRVDRPDQRNDLQARAVAALIGQDFAARTDAQLRDLLRHPDRRVRQKAQFALVDRDARELLLQAAKDPDDARTRICGALGLGILGRRDAGAVAPLLPLLDDGDADLRAVVARVLGDARLPAAIEPLVAALRDPAGRVQREAALALGRIGAAAGEAATAGLVTLLADNGDRDAVLRHAAAIGLARTTDGARLLLERDHATAAVRRGVLLALRHRRDARAAAFLHDRDPAIALEAARAVHDADLTAALPELAALLPTPVADEPLVAWRALNAARLCGGSGDALAIAAFAADPARPLAMRKEAVQILAEWAAPHGQDRVLGNWRPCRHDDAAAAIAAVTPTLIALVERVELVDGDGDLAAAAATACEQARMTAAGPALARLAGDRARAAAARTAALRALAALGDAAVDAVVLAIDADDPTPLRSAAVALFAEREPHKAAPVLATLCATAELDARQAAFASLGTLRDAAGARILGEWLDRLRQGEVEPEVELDLLLAARQRSEPAVQERLQGLAAAAADDPLAAHRACLHGGDVAAGRRVFFDHEATRCTRCHSAEGTGGAAGPRLDGIGSRQSREHLLEALVQPSKAIAAGYSTTILDLHNGELIAGVITRDQDGMVAITGIDGTERTVPVDRIRARRTAGESAMPVMAGPLDDRQLRDVVAFLASLREPAPK